MLFFALFTIKGNVWATNSTEDVTTREIELSVKEELPEPRSVGGVVIPARAFLYNSFVHITFNKMVNQALVLIVNSADNSIVFSQVCKSPADLYANLSEVRPGNYKLEIIIDGMAVWGHFSL